MATRHAGRTISRSAACIGAALLAGGCGLVPQTEPTGRTELPAELVVWGDPASEDDAPFTTVRDVNDEDDRFVVIGADGAVQFSIGRVCRTCDVEGSTILVDGVPTVDIRYGMGPDGEGDRRPYLVSRDGFYIQLVEPDAEEETVTFSETNAVFDRTEVIIWGDPADEDETPFATIGGGDPESDAFVLVTADEEVQVSVGEACEACTVDGSRIVVDDLAMDIRFGTALDGGGGREPLLVTTNGLLVDIQTTGNTFSFLPTDTPLEEDNDASNDLAERLGTALTTAIVDNPGDDLAEREGTIPNPAVRDDTATQPACGIGTVGLLPLILLGMGGLRLARRRR